MTRISRRKVLVVGSVAGSTLPAAALALPRAAPPPRTVVRTSHGRVRGHTVADIATFRGVRYGADTGTRRFQPPPPPSPWRGVVDAVAQGPASPQAGGSEKASEDCLFLNVWTPGCDERARRPVMVYIHGGAYASGSCADPLCDGARLAARGDVVVVTVNHRLNAFGYLYLARLSSGMRSPDSGNCGQLDLVLALQWVRDNVAAFGGDAGRVTGVRPVGRRREDRDADGDACRIGTVPSRRHDERPAGDCIRSAERDRAGAQIPRGSRSAAGTLPRSRDAAGRPPARWSRRRRSDHRQGPALFRSGARRAVVAAASVLSGRASAVGAHSADHRQYP